MAKDESLQMLIGVGNICTQWAFLEFQFSLAIWRLLKVDEATGKIVTGGLDMLPRAGMAIVLARHFQADRALTTALVEARKTIQAGLDVRRNEAVHGVFKSRVGGSDVVVEVHRGKGDRKPKPITAADLTSLGTEIAQVWRALHEVLVAQGIAHPHTGEYIASSVAR
jgi:hypothetical protein